MLVSGLPSAVRMRDFFKIVAAPKPKNVVMM